ncbi:hypothetical protein DFQ28_001746 [Apophysomyces sp. BC1034]|nr:hypothetical protein DFQ28_001746 [Apophysomyces sp. BC1034]
MFDMVDNLTRPLKNLVAGNKGLASALKASRHELAEMGKTQRRIAAFRELRGALAGTASQLNTARERANALAGALHASGPPSRQMRAEFEQAKQSAARLAAEHAKQASQVRALRERLAGAGIHTRHLAQHERELRGSIAATTSTINDQITRLDTLSVREKRLAAARQRLNAVQGTASSMAIGGYAARGSGKRILGSLGGTLGEAKAVQNEMARIRALGLGEPASRDAANYARAMQAMGVGLSDKMTLMRDAMTVFADPHHARMAMPTLAKMKFANEAMFGAQDAHENERQFINMLKVIELRGGTANEATFKKEANRVQKVITATGGRVGGDQWMQFINRGGAAAKSLRDDAFYYQMEPLIQEMGGDTVGTGLMSAYNNVYQGKTTVKAARQLVALGLIGKNGVEYNKMGQVNHFKAGALRGGELFKASPLEWLEQVFLPALHQHGITDAQKIQDTIATVFTNRTASNLMTTMYLQRQQIHKNARLNRGAYGIDELHALATQQAEGKQLAALAKLRDLKQQIGEQVLPVYVRGLAITAKAIGKVTGLLQEHSTAARAVVMALAALAALLVAGGTFTIALAAVLGPLAIVKFSLAALGVQGGMLMRVLRAGSGVLRGFARAILFVGRALLWSPIGLAITGIALTALLIYRYWTPMKGFFVGLWDRVREACHDGIRAMSAAIADWSPLGLFQRSLAGMLSWFGVTLPERFSTFGANLLRGLAHGIASGLGMLKSAITRVANSTIGWFKDKLGIRSPSRVFAELGGFIGQGAAMGIHRERTSVMRAAAGLAASASAAFSPALSFGVPLAQAHVVPLVRASAPIDTRPPPSAARASHSESVTPSPIVINVYAQPGMDAAHIGRMVRAELERAERTRRARLGSRLLITAPFHEWQRRRAWKHRSQSRVGARDARQFVGVGDDTITLHGLVATGTIGSMASLSLLAGMGDSGAAHVLVDGLGNVYGAFVIESFNETATYHTKEGLARKIAFDLTLARVDDNALATAKERLSGRVLQPDYRITVGKRDLTPLIASSLISLSLTESRAEEADTLDIVLDDTRNTFAIPKLGELVRASIGWAGQPLIDKGTFTVDEIEHSGAPDSITIRARSASMTEKMHARHEYSWHRQTIGAIVRTIAARHALKAAVADTLAPIAIAHIDQTHESDLSFLTRLARRYDAVMNVKDRHLLFMPIGAGQTASGQPLEALRLTRASGDQHRYHIAQRESYAAVRAYWHSNGQGKRQSVIVGADTQHNIKVLPEGYTSEAEARAAAEAEYARTQRSQATLSYMLALGRPEAFPEVPVTVSGFKPEIDATPWLVKQATHTISDGGFTSALELEVCGDPASRRHRTRFHKAGQ